MGSISLSGIAKSFGRTRVLHEIALDIAEGEFAVFLGPSGCGKTTLLRLIAGLEDPDAGEIRFDGSDVTDVAPDKRGAAMVFQSYALYPHKNVFDNLAFGLRMARRPREEIEQKVRAAAHRLQIEALLARKPKELSGGQRQRVAIGRAIVRDPKVFLFDEPLSNLDAALRGQMRLELAALHRDLGTTMIYVTHDQVEAMTLADRIVILDGGHIQQVGAPADVYERPANRFVAGFIGMPQMNVLEGVVSARNGADTMIAVGELRIPLPMDAAAVGDRVAIGIRPEFVEVTSDGTPAVVQHAEFIGSVSHLHTIVPNAADARLVIAVPGRTRLAPGVSISVRLMPAACHVFAADGEALWHGAEGRDVK
jgi:multiple sugar transport system ATP-binding protein